MTEAPNSVDILVRQIDAAVEGHLAVGHQDLAMIAVIIMGGYNRLDGREGLCLDPFGFHQLPVVYRERGHPAHAVVHDPDFDALLCLARQNVQDAAPHVTLFKDKIFHEDEFLRLLKLLQHSSMALNLSSPKGKKDTLVWS